MVHKSLNERRVFIFKKDWRNDNWKPIQYNDKGKIFRVMMPKYELI